jgi:hypothetical protein
MNFFRLLLTLHFACCLLCAPTFRGNVGVNEEIARFEKDGDGSLYEIKQSSFITSELILIESCLFCVQYGMFGIHLSQLVPKSCANGVMQMDNVFLTELTGFDHELTLGKYIMIGH